MNFRLINSAPDCKVGQSLAIGVFSNPNGQPHNPEVVDVVIHHWANNKGKITLVFSIPKEPGVMWVGEAELGTRNGLAKKIDGIIRFHHSDKGLAIFGRRGVVLARFENNGNEQE